MAVNTADEDVPLMLTPFFKQYRKEKGKIRTFTLRILGNIKERSSRPLFHNSFPPVPKKP